MIQGKVLDGKTLEPLAYANVVVLNEKGDTTTIGTTTNENGRFILYEKAPYGIAISHIGYDVLKPKKASEEYLLVSQTSMLDEAVITSTRIIKKNKTWLIPVGVISLGVLAYVLYYKKI